MRRRRPSCICRARAWASDEHALGEVEAYHLGAERGRGEGEVAGAAGQIEDAFARLDRGGGDQSPLPMLIAAVRQQPRDQIVAIGDRVKEPRDVAGLAGRASTARLSVVAARRHGLVASGATCRHRSGRMLGHLLKPPRRLVRADYAAVEHCRKLSQSHPSGAKPYRRRADARADGAVGVIDGGRAWNGDDHGEDAGGFGAGGLRAVFRRQVDAGGREAGRDGAAASSARGAVPRPRDGYELGGSARRSGTARTCGVGSADRSHRRDAGTAGGRSAWRSDSGSRRRHPGGGD